MPQASHLIEHLVFRGATKGFKAGESAGLLERKGSANAETMPSFTHYDYVMPPGDLELALRVEAERLSGLRLEPDIVKTEAAKCYAEAVNVENNPQSGNTKFAFAAMAQAWRYGSKHARVKSGLEARPVADLERFHRSYYQPANALVVIVGGFDRQTALALVKKHLGSVPAGRVVDQPIDWTTVPKATTVTWDSKVRAVCIGLPPPASPEDRLLLDVWGTLLMQALMAAPEVKALSDAVFCSNITWNVDVLPFFIYAAAKPSADIAKLEGVLESHLRNYLAQPIQIEQIRQIAAMGLGKMPQLTQESIRQQAEAYARQSGTGPNQAEAAVIGNAAIQVGLRDLVAGSEPEKAVEYLNRLSDKEAQLRLRRTLDPKNQFTTMLEPIDADQ